MARQAITRKKYIMPKYNHMNNRIGARLRDFILGWQDGLVNVLGVVLGVATATKSFSVIIIAAIAAAFAESISMAAVAYTSFKAEREFYLSEIARKKKKFNDMPKASPANIAAVVGLSAIFGSFIPIVPFFIFPIKEAVWATLVISTTVLFFVGAYKAKVTMGNPIKSGAEMAAIGMLAALAGYAIGALLGARFV